MSSVTLHFQMSMLAADDRCSLVSGQLSTHPLVGTISTDFTELPSSCCPLQLSSNG